MHSYRAENGKSGLDQKETKLPTYWSTPFQQLCVGMRIKNSLRFIPISYKAASLHKVISDGNFSSTNVPRSTWKSLYHDSSLQENCGRQGFNVVAGWSDHARVRLGILGNQENDCNTADSFIGFGATDKNQRGACGPSNIINSCGNSAHCFPDNGDKEVRAMGYIFVR